MKKSIAIVALDERAAGFYGNQILELFGDLVETHIYSVKSGTVQELERADLYVVTTDAFDSHDDFLEHIPIDGETVELLVTFKRDVVEKLNAIPKGTKALFVNLSEKMVREAITRLNQLGINHIDFVSYYPGAEAAPDCHLAVTPAETRYVPSHIKEVIDIGQRVLDSSTIVEIALKLKLDFLLEDRTFKEYFQSVAANSYSFNELFGRSARQESRFEILLEILDEGIIGINEENRIFACNKKAAEIVGVNQRLVLHRLAFEVFPDIPFRECSQARIPVTDRIIRIQGADLNVSVSPVLRGDEYVGAFATVQRFNEQESKQHSLRIQLLNKGHKAKYTFPDIIGQSPAIKKAVTMAEKMARTNSSVLITGESGTGKELFAHAIHNASERQAFPFIAINCAAMPDNLLESELFGYEDGAFTGAKKGGKLGLFEFAHKGTIFLDEVEGMSQALQVKLLRVIQEREVMRVGGAKIISVDVRIVAATNESLEELVASGSFRKDLYYRLNTLPIQIPPLRERTDDILLLCEHFRQALGGTYTLSEEVRQALEEHRWDGNIRELRNYAEYFSYMDKQTISLGDLPPGFYSQLSRKQTPAKELNLDQESLQRLAGRRLPDYVFVLKVLQQESQKGSGAGRDTILTASEEENKLLSQKEVRDILSHLEALSLIKVSRGRGGSKITEKGTALLQILLESTD